MYDIFESYYFACHLVDQNILIICKSENNLLARSLAWAKLYARPRGNERTKAIIDTFFTEYIRLHPKSLKRKMAVRSLKKINDIFSKCCVECKTITNMYLNFFSLSSLRYYFCIFTQKFMNLVKLLQYNVCSKKS